MARCLYFLPSKEIEKAQTWCFSYVEIHKEILLENIDVVVR